jgi:hypothetical protein
LKKVKKDLKKPQKSTLTPIFSCRFMLFFVSNESLGMRRERQENGGSGRHLQAAGLWVTPVPAFLIFSTKNADLKVIHRGFFLMFFSLDASPAIFLFESIVGGLFEFFNFFCQRVVKIQDREMIARKFEFTIDKR